MTAPAGVEEREPIDQFEREAARASAQKAAEDRTRNGNRARWVEPSGEGAAASVPASVRTSIRKERARVVADARKGGGE